MPLLDIVAQGHEWGFEVSDGFIPAIGDTVSLWYATPGEPEDSDDRMDGVVSGIVTKREWCFATDFHEENRVFLYVKLHGKIPDDCVADSTEWPASERPRRNQGE